jgi:pteridine reductase
MALNDKVVLITGGSKRLGRAMAISFANQGFKVAITYRTSADDAIKVVHKIKANAGYAVAYPCDVTKPSSVKQLFTRFKKDFKRLDVLINNASIYQTVKFEKITPKQWEDTLLTNVRGPYIVAQEAITILRKSNGRIINLGSLGGIKPWSTHAHYCSSKAALHMLTLGMAKAYSPEVSVNCVAPGMIEFGGEKRSSLNQKLANKTPMQRNGSAEDVVSAIGYFATCTQFITGQIITVDGGLSLV